MGVFYELVGCFFQSVEIILGEQIIIMFVIEDQLNGVVIDWFCIGDEDIFFVGYCYFLVWGMILYFCVWVFDM